MRRTVLTTALGFVCASLIWCGGKTGDGVDADISSCTFLVTTQETVCEESDSAAALDRCHHELDDFIDGGLDVEIVAQPCGPTGGLGCCVYSDDSGGWTVCYYDDALAPVNVEGFCAKTDGAYVAR